MKSLIITLITSLLVLNLTAQQYYRFEQDTASYTELLPANAILHPAFNSDKLTPINLDGETFNFFGLDYDFGGLKTCHIQTNGNMRIDNDSSAVIIDGIFTDLDSIDHNTSLSYEISGVSGQKIVKTQWRHVAIAAGQPGNFVNFQIWMFQESGIIELRYGPSSAGNATGYTQSNGPYAGAFYSDDAFGTLYEKIWVYGQPPTVGIDSSASFSFKRLLGVPADGTVWRFIPKGYEDPGVGMKEHTGQLLKVFPNPATDFLSWTGVEGRVKHLQITDQSGRRVMVEIREKNRIGVSDLKPGWYILSVQTEDGVFRTPFVKVLD